MIPDAHEADLGPGPVLETATLDGRRAAAARLASSTIGIASFVLVRVIFVSDRKSVVGGKGGGGEWGWR